MVIIKCGGDSLSTPKNQNLICSIISSFSDKVVVVTSAMGREGFPYSTYSLNKLCEDNYLSKKERDRLLSVGEIISSIRLSYLLNKKNIKAYALSYLEIGFICDKNFSDGNVLSLEEKMKSFLDKYDCLCVPGFIGKTIDDEVITLGRGNSDLTSILISKIFNEKRVILYKNVDGVFHTSPAVYKRLDLYGNISYQQMLLLNEIGFEIVSKKALIEAEKNNIAIEIRNFVSNEVGTVISSVSSKDIFLGFNIIDKTVLIASYDVYLIQEVLKKAFAKIHVFIKEEKISGNIYSFEINKSIELSVKRTILEVMDLINHQKMSN